MEIEQAEFEKHRQHLLGLAYRMLGSVAEAEDSVQDAYLRWHGTNQAKVANPRAFLSTVVTHISLDRLKEARRHRETYVGEWLPEPLLVDPLAVPVPSEALAHDVSFALMLALERLSPLERASFLLHDVFDMGFEEIARTLERSEASCRQLASRARSHLKNTRTRYVPSKRENERIAGAFFATLRSGEIGVLRDLLAAEATLHSDGGGQKTAALNPIVGADKLGKLFQGLFTKRGGKPPLWSKRLDLNGLPGEISVQSDGTLQTTALEIGDDRIQRIYVTRNPEKLRHLAYLVPASVGSGD